MFYLSTIKLIKIFLNYPTIPKCRKISYEIKEKKNYNVMNKKPLLEAKIESVWEM